MTTTVNAPNFVASSSDLPIWATPTKYQVYSDRACVIHWEFRNGRGIVVWQWPDGRPAIYYEVGRTVKDLSVSKYLYSLDTLEVVLTVQRDRLD